MSESSRRLDLERAGPASREPLRALVVVEEPLEIRLDGEPIAVTMRTPGHDVELAVGFLISEGIFRDPADVAAAAHCADSENIVEVRSAPGSAVDRPGPRSFYATSSCGICGKASIEAVRVRLPDVRSDRTQVTAQLLLGLPARLRAAQQVFEDTGSVHAAGLFSAEGALLCAREDVGRHNAVDKLIGWAALRELLPLQGHVMMLSGRCGFELVQKALAARVPILAAISGPSSLAIELARESGMTLAAFVRGEHMNLCSGPERVLVG